MRIVITGPTGYTASFLISKLLQQGDCEVVGLGRRSNTLFSKEQNYQEVKLDYHDSILSALVATAPDAIIHLAAMSSPAECENAPALAHESNVLLTYGITQLAKELDCFLCHVSTDLVFDGYEEAPEGGFTELNRPRPRSIYAKTKYEAEKIVCESGLNACVVRTSLIYGPLFSSCWHHGESSERMDALAAKARSTFLSWITDHLRENEEVRLFTDEWRTPVYVFDLVDCLIKLTRSRVSGLFHCSGSDRASRMEFGKLFAQIFGFSESLLRESLRSDLRCVPARPKDVSLNHSKLVEATNHSFYSLEGSLRDILEKHYLL